MDKNWLDSKMEYLNQTMGIFKHLSVDFLFEPTNEFYSKLEIGTIASFEDTMKMIDKGQVGMIPPNIQKVANRIAKHIGLKVTPRVDYEAILSSDLFSGDKHTVAEIKGNNIKVSSNYEKKSKALGAILAHEITHFVLNTKGIILSNKEENERFTDLAAIMLGLGKLMLNGHEANPGNILGYLTFIELVYAYEKQNAMRGIVPDICLANLTDGVSVQVRQLMHQREHEWNKTQDKITSFLKKYQNSLKLISKIEKRYQELVANQCWVNENIHNIKIIDKHGNIFVQLNNYIFEQYNTPQNLYQQIR